MYETMYMTKPTTLAAKNLEKFESWIKDWCVANDWADYIRVYAITAHKSQGSQLKRVVVPIRDWDLFDQALLNTAVTKGVDQEVLFGDERTCLWAIQSHAAASNRHFLL